MNRSAWVTRYRQLGRDAVFLLLSGPLSLLAFYLVVPLTALGVVTTIIWVGLLVLVLDLSIAGGFANIARLAVARVDGREPVPGGYLEPEPGSSARRRLFRRLRDPQRWMDLLWAVIYFPVSLITWIISVVWLALAVGGLLAPIVDITLDLVLDPSVGQRQGLAHLLGLQPELLWDIVFNLTCGVIFSLTAPAVLRSLVALLTGLSRGMLSWRSEVGRLQTSRAAVQRAEADTRRRLERDIHDGPQQRLVRLRMDLARAQRQAEKDPAAASAIIQGAMDQTQQTLDELRQLSRGIAPPVLVDRGLAAAITEAATRSAVPVTVSTELSQDLPDHVSQAAYFVVSESLANLNKHSGATAAGVEARVVDGSLQVRISDNGIGGASTAKGHGLAGLVERLSGVDGRLTLTSPTGGPTTVEAMIPCAF